MASVDVRDAEPEDLPGVMAIEDECFGSERFSPETVRVFMEREDAFLLVALEGQRVIGAAMCIASPRCSEAKIASIAVLKEFRRKGVGSALLRECESKFVSGGASRSGLEVEVNNQPAIDLYSKHGYQLIGIVRGYYSNGRDAYYMEKALKGWG